MLTSIELKTNHAVSIDIEATSKCNDDDTHDIIIRCSDGDDDAAVRYQWDRASGALVIKGAGGKHRHQFLSGPVSSLLVQYAAVYALYAFVVAPWLGLTAGHATWRIELWAQVFLSCVLLYGLARAFVDAQWVMRSVHHLAGVRCVSGGGGGVVGITMINVGRHGALTISRRLLSPECVEIQSGGGSLTLLADGGEDTVSPRIATLRLSGNGVIDGGGVTVDDLCIICGVGSGAVSGWTARREFQLVVRASIDKDPDNIQHPVAVAASYYKITVDTLPQCRVSMAGSTTRRNIRLNGVLNPGGGGDGEEEEEDIFMERVLSVSQ